MVKKTTLRIRCCYHKQNFGFVLFMGTKDGQGVTGISDGICPECAKIEREKFEREKKR